MKTEFNYTYFEREAQKVLSFSMELELPFTPFYGLSIILKSRDKENYPDDDEITIPPYDEKESSTISYSIEENKFFVDIISYTNWLSNTEDNNIDDEIKFFENFGWTLTKNEQGK